MADDDHTLVGAASWQDLGGQELTVLPQPPLLDEQTAREVQALCRAMRTLCQAKTIAIGFGISILLVVLAGLIVGIFGNPPVP